MLTLTNSSPYEQYQLSGFARGARSWVSILGLHEDPASAQRFLANRVAWLDEAQEVWSALLEPFRHHGTANYLDRAHGTSARVST